MEKFNDKIVEQLTDVIKAKLKHFEEKGLIVNIADTRYSDIYMETKITITLATKGEEAEQERKRFFEENCESVGLSKENYGMIITLPNSNMQYQIAGLDFHEDEPVLLRSLMHDDGKFFRMSIVDVKRMI